MPFRDRLRAKFDRRQRPILPVSQPSPSQSVASHTAPVQPAGGDPAQCIPVKPPVDGLWDKAYEILKADQPELIAAYESALSAQTQAGPTQPTVPPAQPSANDRETQLTAVLAEKTETAIASRMKITFWPGKRVAVRDCFDKIVKKVIVAEGFIGQAVSGEPHAALAWAGVSFILPLLLKPVQQDVDAWEGLDKVTDMVTTYRVVEICLRDRSSGTPPEIEALHTVMEQRIRKLFSMILEYQIRLVCHLERSTAFQVLRDIVVSDDWASMLKEIQILESAIAAQIRISDSHFIRTSLQQQAVQGEKILTTAIQQDLRLQSMLQGIASIQSDIASIDKKWQGRWKEEDRERCISTFRCEYDYEAGKRRIVNREKGTCAWFLQHEKFKHWRDSDISGFLFVTAEPGCGKTVLSKYLVDSALESPRDRYLCYWFFKDETAPQRSTIQALRALISQLLSRNKHLVDMILWHKEWRDHLTHISNQYGNLCDVLFACVRTLGKEVVCLIDALDECGVEHRQLLINTLNEFFRRAGKEKCDLKVLMTGRPYFNVEFKFQNLISRLPLDAYLAGEDESVGDEMSIFIRNQVGSMDLSEPVKAFLIGKLIDFQAKTRTYLLLKIIFENIRNNPDLKNASEKKLTKFIKDLPLTVFDAYEQFLEKNTNRAQAELLLRIILAAFRAMTVQEINTAFFIARNADEDFEGIGYAEWQDEMQPESDFKVTMRTLCGLFVTIIDQRVYLIHQTARDFLLLEHEHLGADGQNHQGKSMKWRHSIDLPMSHLLVARACVIYLLMQDFDDHRTVSSFLMKAGMTGPDLDLDFQKQKLLDLYPFAEYATVHFTSHISRSLDLPLLPPGAWQVLDLGSARFWTIFQANCIFNGNENPSRGSTDLFLCRWIENSKILYDELEVGAERVFRDFDTHLCPSEVYWTASDGLRLAREKLGEDFSICREIRRPIYRASDTSAPPITPTRFELGSRGWWRLPEEDDTEYSLARPEDAG